MRIDHQQAASHPCNLGLAFVGLFDPEEVYAPVQIRSNVLHVHAVNRHGWRLTQGVKVAHHRDSLEADGVADVGPVGLVDTLLTALAGQPAARRAWAATCGVAAGARPRSVAAAHGSPQPGAGPQGRRRFGSVSSGLRKRREGRVRVLCRDTWMYVPCANTRGIRSMSDGGFAPASSSAVTYSWRVEP